jgi:tetratricopeptide (TPR) repeat protein
MMRTLIRLLPTVTLIAFAAACSHHQDLRTPSAQDNFGVQMARMNLWREALFRFQRAVELNPQDAMARNNLAVAFEANGDFERARKEYLEALKLDRSNQYIQKNYSRFVEFLSRNRKRQQRDVKTAASASSTATVGVSSSPLPPSQLPGPPLATEPVKPPSPPNTNPPTDMPQPQPPAAPNPTPPRGAR